MKSPELISMIKERTIAKLDRLMVTVEAQRDRDFIESVKQQFVERGFLTRKQTTYLKKLDDDLKEWKRCSKKLEDFLKDY